MAEYIDKQTAIDLFQRLAYDDWNQGANTSWANAYDEAAELIRNIPHADVQPVRRGYWKKIGNPTWWGLYECSECHQISSIDYCWCTNCGARMDGA